MQFRNDFNFFYFSSNWFSLLNVVPKQLGTAAPSLRKQAVGLSRSEGSETLMLAGFEA